MFTARSVAVTASALAVLGTGTAAYADAPPAVQTIVTERVSGAEVSEAARTTPAARAEAAIGRHVAEQARQGRLVDRKNVQAAAVAGGEVTWERGSAVDELRLDRHLVGGGGESADLVELALIGAEQDAPGTAPGAVAGAGMTGSSSLSGGTRLANYCQTWTYEGNNVTGCVEKFKPNRDYSAERDYYAYNRWGTAQGKEVDWDVDWKVTKFDIRSRPRDGYENRTKGMNDYFPNDATQLCNEGGSAGMSLGSLSFTIGLTNCSEKYPVPNATTITMGLVYDAGAIFESRTKGADYEQEVWTWQDAVAPSLGFYNYGKFCKGSYLNCKATIGTDGW